MDGDFTIPLLFPEAELGDGLFVQVEIGGFEVFEKFLTLPYHLHETALSHKVMFIILNVLRHLFDASGKNSHLNFRRTNIFTITGDAGNSFIFILFCYHSATIIAHFCGIIKG